MFIDYLLIYNKIRQRRQKFDTLNEPKMEIN